MPAGADPFGTEALRARVCAGWAASVARFREDANAEEDYALGAYRDGVVVELAQNGADAASRAGVPGQLRLVLADGVLSCANTGAPLDADGVQSLCTLRASAKRTGSTTGRFGVGFAAVLAVTDAPEVLSTTGGVRWSLPESRALVAGLPALIEELERRRGAVPVLRLPFPASGEPPTGFDTVVRLPLRDPTAEALVRRLLTEVDPALLLTLPGLTELDLEVDGVTRRLSVTPAGPDLLVRDGGEVTRWRVARDSGRVPEEMRSGRPTEEQVRTSWQVIWAVPLDEKDRPAPLPSSVPAVVRAPTPTDEPLSVPGVLAASLPLEPGRRRLVPGPLTDEVLRQAARVYAELVADLALSPAVLDLVPVGLAGGEVDGRLQREILERLAETAFLPGAETDAVRLRPRDARLLALPAVAVARLAEVLPGLLPSAWASRQAPLAVLGVAPLPVAEAVESLRGLRREPDWWHELYDAIAAGHLGGPERDALGALPVPLADGRLVAGPRGLLLSEPDTPTRVAGPLGLRVVHPGATHPVLRLLGAEPATPRTLLEAPATRAAVAASLDADDPEPIAEAVLTLVAAAHVRADDLPWLAELALPADDGEVVAAGELVLPGSPLAGVLADDALGRPALELLDRWPADVLTAVGVLDTFAVLNVMDVPVDPDGAEQLDVDVAAEWLELVRARLPATDLPPVLPEVRAVRDLEMVRPDGWAEALTLLAQPRLLPVLTEPAFALLPDGQRVAVPSYTSWWLSTHPVLAGRRPVELRLPTADPLLAGLFDEADPGLPAGVLAAIGVRADLDELLADPDGAADLLNRLADPIRVVGRAQLRQVYARLTGCSQVPLPDRLRAVRHGAVVVLDAADALVVDAPDLLPLLGHRGVIPVPLHLAADLADLLDLPLAAELGTYPVVSAGTERPVPPHVEELLGEDCPASYVEHAALRVLDADGEPVGCVWRLVAGVPHATVEGLGRALAASAGRWADRLAVDALLRDPDALPRLLAEADLDG
jgi:hypothetical protein